MPIYNSGGATRTPFGQNQPLRSTKVFKDRSWMCAASGVPAETIDGNAEKVLQPGTVMAKITSGGDTGKIGAFHAGASDGRQTAANIVGVCKTFLPWQLLEGDREVAVFYAADLEATACFEYNAGGVRIPIVAGTITALQADKNFQFTF